MPLEPELEAIFNQDPRFAQVLAEYERNGTSNADPLRADPEHAGVTEEALQAYLDRFYPPRNPEFRSGQGQAKPPTGGWEDGEPGPRGNRGNQDDQSQNGHGAPQGVIPGDSGQQRQEPTQQDGVQPPTGSASPPVAPVAAPSQPQSGEGAPGSPDPRAATSSDPFRPNQEVDPRALEGFRQFDAALRSDPRLQQILLHYSTTGRIPADLLEPAQARTFIPPEPPPGLDLEDPAVRTLWAQHVDAQRQQFEQTEEFNEAISRLSSRIDETSSEYQARIDAENQGIVDRAITSFAHEKGLDPNEAQRISEIAANLGIAAHYMQGRDPITRLPVRPDPMAAVTRALEVAYSQDPIAQERERQRWIAAEKARIQQDQDRRRKLAGVGGGSGTQPRQPAEPTSREDRLGAAADYLRTIMYGEPGGQE